MTYERNELLPNNKTKILIVVPSLTAKNGGGIATSVMNYFEALNRYESTEVTVVATISQKETESIDSSIVNNKNFILFKTNGNKWHYSKDLNVFLKNEVQTYDIVWVHGIWLSQSYFVSRYAIKHRIPYVITPHGSLNPYAIKQKKIKKHFYWHLIEKRIFQKVAAIHCLTDFEEKSVHNISNIRTFVLPNTIDVDAFESKDYNELNHICFIGRFHHKKALDLLLEAFSDIQDVSLFIAGEGEKEYKEYIYSIVAKYNLENRVTFFGYVDDAMKKNIFSKSIFCVMPSHSEGLAMVGLEAIAYSTPVIATQQCDFEIIEKWDAGIVIENNQPEVIREGIKKMMSEDIAQMSKNSYRLAKEHFDLEVIGKRLLEQFEAIVKLDSMKK